MVAGHAASAPQLALGVIEASALALVESHVVVSNILAIDIGNAITAKSGVSQFGFRINS